MKYYKGLGLLKLAETVLILINPSPSNVKSTMSWLQGALTIRYLYKIFRVAKPFAKFVFLENVTFIVQKLTGTSHKLNGSHPFSKGSHFCRKKGENG